MASPQEIIEMSMYHPVDATDTSRKTAAARVMRALAANDLIFARRATPVSESDDGKCPHCKTTLVHVDHGDMYMDALQRAAALQHKVDKLSEALHQIADGHCGDPVAVAQRGLT